jgi:hypothetical protein
MADCEHEWCEVDAQTREWLLERARRMFGWPLPDEVLFVLCCAACGRGSLRSDAGDADVVAARRRPVLLPFSAVP